MAYNCNYTLYDKKGEVIITRDRVACYASLFITSSSQQSLYWETFDKLTVFIDRIAEIENSYYHICTFSDSEIEEFIEVLREMGFIVTADLNYIPPHNKNRKGVLFTLNKADYVGFNQVKACLFFLRLLHEEYLPTLIIRYLQLKKENPEITDRLFLFWLATSTNINAYSGHGLPLFTYVQRSGSTFYFLKNRIPSKALLEEFFKGAGKDVSESITMDFRNFCYKKLNDKKLEISYEPDKNDFTKKQIEQIKEFYEQ